MAKDDRYREACQGLVQRHVEHLRRQENRDVTPQERVAIRKDAEKVAERNWRRRET